MPPVSDRVSQTLLCAGMLLIWYTVSLLINTLPCYALLVNHNLLMPVFYLLEFSLLLPLYCWYVRHYDGIRMGQWHYHQAVLFSALLILLLVSQTVYMPRENWTAGQGSNHPLHVMLFALAVIVFVPIYEEILFRGFLLHGFLQWIPQQKIACSVLTSLTFTAIHTQYVHVQTLIALFILSLLLCAARFVSDGLKLPIFLHAMNNLIAIAPWLWFTFLH